MSLARATWDSGAETWIVFYGSCVKRYRAFEVLLALLPPACPPCHRLGTVGLPPSPRPRYGGVTSQAGETALWLEHGGAGGKGTERCTEEEEEDGMGRAGLACSTQLQKSLSKPFC